MGIQGEQERTTATDIVRIRVDGTGIVVGVTPKDDLHKERMVYFPWANFPPYWEGERQPRAISVEELRES